MTLSDHEQLNTVADWFDVQFRYFAGPNYGMMTKDGIRATLEPWASPDSPLPNWTEITDRIAYASKFAQILQGSSSVWTADLSGWNYDDALLGLGLSLICWRRFWRPTTAVGLKNLVANGSFEEFVGTRDNSVSDTFTGWQNAYVNDGAGNRIEATAVTAVGATAVKLTKTTQHPFLEQWVSVKSATTYRLVIFQRGDGSAGVARLNVFTTAFSSVFAATIGMAAATWQRCEYTFTTPNDCEQIGIFLSGPAEPGCCYVDAVELVEFYPVGWQPWHIAYCGEIISRNDRNNYQNGKAWQRTVTGLNYHLSGINAPRVTAGRIRVAEGASVTGNTALEPVEAERDKGEFVGGRANVDLANITDGNRNTVYISGTIPAGAAVPFPTPIWDGRVLPSEVFIKPWPGWGLDRSWWVEVYNGRSADNQALASFAAATWEGGAPVYQYSNTGESWQKLTSGQCGIFCAHRKTFDELTGADNNGAEWIVDISQFADIHLSNDAAMRIGNAVIAWAPGGASRDYVFTGKYGTVEWHGATFNSSLLSDGQSFINSMAGQSAAVGNWSVNPYPHPGGNDTGEGPVWVKVTLPDNVCQTLDAVSAASTTIRLDNYRSWMVNKGAWAASKGVINGCVFNWTSRDANGLHGVTWANAPAAPIPANTRCYPYANGEAQTGYPLTATHLVRRKTPVIESYRVYWSQYAALDYTETGWRNDYYDQSHTIRGNSQNLRLTDRLGDSAKGSTGNNYLWVRTILYLIDHMSDGGRAKINEFEADIAQMALDLSGTASLDGQNSSALVRYLVSDWAGVNESDFIDESFDGAHLMGQHALAITPVDRVLDDLARGTGCLADFAPTGGLVWREDAWWPRNGVAPSVVWPFDGNSYRGDVEVNQVPAQVDFVILNAMSLEGDPHSLRVVYPTSLTTEPPVWAMVREVSDKIVALDSDAQAVAQIELEKMVLSNRGARLTVKGSGEWARPGLRVGLYFDYTGAGVEYRTWLIQAVNVNASESGRQRTYQTDLELMAFRG